MSSSKSRREAILAAAADLVRESGAAHLTLDAVSARANVSKGGLLYHFKTKEALIEAMVLRLEELLAKTQEIEYAKLPPSPARALKALVVSMEIFLHRQVKPITGAILAAGAYDPKLLKHIKITHKKTIEQMKSSGLSPAFIQVIIFAGMGLLLSEMLGTASHTRRERRAFFDELLRIVGQEELRLCL